MKSENLFVTKDGRVKILDFGLAKLTHSESRIGPDSRLPTETAGTEPGVVMGTLGYMSPEQVRGTPADARSDIFSLGAILYEMLSGRRAVHGDSAADTMSAILKEDPPELSVTNQSASPSLERIVRHCLEKNPEQRFHSAHDLAFDLSVAMGESARPDLPSPRRPARAWVGALLSALVVILAGLVWRTRGGKAVGPGASAPDRKSVAALPFQNLSPDPENGFFADGMTEDILTQLAKIRDLKVISRSSVMRSKGTQKPIQIIAAELGVATVLEGSVRRAGNRVRIDGQLVDARTDEHLWAETYDREIKDVFAIQSEVAQQIAAALRATLSPAEKKRIEQSPTRNLAAYDQYLKGRDLYYRYRKADNETAIGLFQKALELDSGFALAYAGLGDTYAQRALRFDFSQSWLQSSLEVSRKAIALDPELAEGYKALGLAYYTKGAYRESLDAYKRTVAINPNFMTAISNIGATLRNLGRFDEALPWILRAAELDPRNPVVAANVGTVYAALGDVRQAERWLKRSLDLQPDLGGGHAYLIYFLLHQRRLRAGQRGQAEALLQESLAATGGRGRLDARPGLQGLSQVRPSRDPNADAALADHGPPHAARGSEAHIDVIDDIVNSMKTTVEIPEGLLQEARRLAAREGTTVRAFIEAGLRKEIKDRKGRGRFQLRRASFRGNGLRPGLAGATWEQIRDLAYEGRT